MGTILLYLGVIVLTIIVYIGMEWTWMWVEMKLTRRYSPSQRIMNYIHMLYVGVWLIGYGVLMGLFIDNRTIFALIGGLFAIPITDELKKYKSRKAESYSY